MTLAGQIVPCGPVVDQAAADRARERLEDASASPLLEQAWPALAPIVAASPYLAGLCRRMGSGLVDLLGGDPSEALTERLSRLPTSEPELRILKAEIHLLTALCDLGGLWDLEAVTGALSDFADLATRAAFEIAAREQQAAGRLLREDDAPFGFVPGLFCLGMGKLGARELNYSSDIDISLFFDPETLTLAPGVESQAFATRFTDRVAAILQARTAQGYVFRVDLRLRPDPSSTPNAVSLPSAFVYYETVGQNWERAAFIKARAMGGDIALGESFLHELRPFIWRRNLDFAAIADIHAIKRQIHAHKVDERLTAAGADLKLGRGGIREIEFFVQTQQLILGGRQPSLRHRETLAALHALADHGHVTREDAATLEIAYRELRALEHRAQMIADEQTHRLPENADQRKAIAALAGYSRLPSFDAAVSKTLRTVNAIYARLFAGEEALSSDQGSLIFTGVEDDPETLATLGRLGFKDAAKASALVRAWHHGRIGATRTERGRELFTRLAPRLLDACSATGAPDTAFSRFADFFSRVTAGVQLQSLLIAQPALLELLVRVMAFAPGFARTLSRRPAVLDALLDPGFFEPPRMAEELGPRLAQPKGFEAAMDLARRLHAEMTFRIGVQLLGGAISAEAAGAAFADLADTLIGALSTASLAEVERMAGGYAGDVAVIALGKCGSREMTAGSDLDLMTLYRPAGGGAVSAVKGWDAVTVYTRFTQRLVTALSAPTREGGLYEVDLRLRPSGTHGPVAVSLAAFDAYYAERAEVWEFLALTRARVVWASGDAFFAAAAGAIEAALRRPRDEAETLRETREMRALMDRERAPKGFWDLKLSAGGMVDIEFYAQLLQILAAPAGGPLRQNTAEALAALREHGAGSAADLDALDDGWRMNAALNQILKVALEDGADPAQEPRAFRALLAKSAREGSWRELVKRLGASRRHVRTIFTTLTRLADTTPPR